MCGIAGMVQTHPDGEVEQATVHRMCEAMVHRGPDDEGIFVKAGVGLGMRRLSIIDLAGGHQPVFNEDKTIWIVFNGEIYNFPELRTQLQACGHRFSTHTDTEVIAHLYEEHGAECVHKLRGMFAFALYDERAGRLLLARDRVGKKPLHYALQNGTLLFASEMKAILAVRPELAELNNPALLQYMYSDIFQTRRRHSSRFRSCLRDTCWNSRRESCAFVSTGIFPRMGPMSPGAKKSCCKNSNFA